MVEEEKSVIKSRFIHRDWRRLGNSDSNVAKMRLEDEIQRETLTNISTGNKILDEHLRELIEGRAEIPQYLQVINNSEISEIADIEGVFGIKKKIQSRLSSNGLLIPRNSGGIGMGAVLSKAAVPAPYFGQIEEYCVVIGKNSYRGSVYNS